MCLSKFEEGVIARKLLCNHLFHKECIEQWIKAKINEIPRCPMCNTTLTSERPPGYVERNPNEVQNAVIPQNTVSRQPQNLIEINVLTETHEESQGTGANLNAIQVRNNE